MEEVKWKWRTGRRNSKETHQVKVKRSKLQRELVSGLDLG